MSKNGKARHPSREPFHLKKRLRIRSMTPEAIDFKLMEGSAHPIVPATSAAEHPAVMAFSSEEQTIWVLRSTGMTLREIGDFIGRREDDVCRAMKEMKARLGYLLAFRDVLLQNPKLIETFLAGKHCGRCLREAKPK